MKKSPVIATGDFHFRETFRVLKEKEVRLCGDALQSDVKIGVGGVSMTN